MSPCNENYTYSIDSEVLSWFHNQQFCKDTSIRRATHEDIPRLLEVNTINPLYFKAEDFKTALNAKNEFILVAERINFRGKPVIVGLIHYYLIWYCPHSRIRKQNTGNPPVVENAHHQQVVYVCTLQTIHEETHKKYIQRHGIASEYGTGKLLFCLACQHGIERGLKYLFLDSTENAVSFYKTVFLMTENRVENREYVPLQLALDTFDYHMITNPKLVSFPSCKLYCTVHPDSLPLARRHRHKGLHLQFTSCGTLKEVRGINPSIPSSNLHPDLKALFTSSDPSELSLALSSLVNYSQQSKANVDWLHIDHHLLPLYNSSTENALMIHQYWCDHTLSFDEIAVELIRMIDELNTCMTANYQIITAVKDELFQDRMEYLKLVQKSHEMEAEYQKYLKRHTPSLPVKKHSEIEVQLRRPVVKAKRKIHKEKEKHVLPSFTNTIVSISDSAPFYKEFQISQKKVSKSALIQFVRSSSFQKVFTPAKEGDETSYRYLHHLFGGIPREIIRSRMGHFSYHTLLQADNSNSINLEQAMDRIRSCQSNTRTLSTSLIALLSVALFSVYPPHVVVTNCFSNNRGIARSQLVEVRKVCVLCNQIENLLSELNRILQQDHPVDSCICSEQVGHGVGTLVCNACKKPFHCSCLGLIPTEYPDMVQTKFWGYWMLERGFVCPRCCTGDLFEVSRVLKGVVQIKDSVVQHWYSKQKKSL